MAMKKLSIVTICYNNAEGLKKTFNSVFSQKRDLFEYVVVDGGSNDGSKELIDSFRSNIDRWVSEKDGGIYDALNKGWRMSEGEYVIFMNAGDRFADADVVEVALKKLQPGIGIAFGDAQLEDERGIYRTKTHPEKIKSSWLIKEVVAHQSQFIRRSLLEKNGGYDLQYKVASDYAFFAKLFWSNQMRIQNLGMVVSVFNTEGLSSSPLQKQRIEQERKAIHKRYAPVMLRWMYYAYRKFNRIIGR